MCVIIKLMIILTNIIIVNVFIWFDKVLKKHGLTEYMDEAFIRNTSRELITALQVSPDELNAAADALLKQEIQVKITKFSNNLVMLIHKIFHLRYKYIQFVYYI